MARSNISVDMNRAAIVELMRTPALVAGPAEAIAAACNAESSWGGYDFEVEVSPTRARARVWSSGSHDDEARQNRLVRNLGAQ